jgi:hypothetical protein
VSEDKEAARWRTTWHGKTVPLSDGADPDDFDLPDSEFANRTAARIGRLAEEVFRGCQVLTCHFDGNEWHLCVLDMEGKRRVHSAPHLAALFSQATGRAEAKVCRTCGKTKRLSQFSRDCAQSDGLRPRCKTCERIRVRIYDLDRRAKQRQARQQARDAANGNSETGPTPEV